MVEVDGGRDGVGRGTRAELHPNTISFNHPCVCRIELSNPSRLIVVCKRGSVEFTDTVRQRGFS